MVSTAPLCLSPRFPVCLLPPSDAAHLGDKSDGKSFTSYKWRMVISYDGTRFKGWQYQPAPIPTVQWHIGDALIQITKLQRGDLCLIGAGRTDTGVHSFGCIVMQVGRGALPPDIVTKILEERDREEIAKFTLAVPPHGLCLMSVKYNPEKLKPPPGTPHASFGRRHTVRKCKIPFY